MIFHINSKKFINNAIPFSILINEKEEDYCLLEDLYDSNYKCIHNIAHDPATITSLVPYKDIISEYSIMASRKIRDYAFTGCALHEVYDSISRYKSYWGDD